MSLTLNMVGGGGISGNRAVLVARVPSGSDVIASKGGVTLTPTMWVSETYPDQDIALFVFSSSQFDSVNPWTITATDSDNTASAEVFITNNKEYEVEIAFLAPTGTYQNVEYLEATGTQYIQLGVTPVVNMAVEAKLKSTVTSTTANGLIGYNGSGGGTAYRWRVMWSPAGNNARYGVYVGTPNDVNVVFNNGAITSDPVTITFSQATSSQSARLQYGSVDETKNVASATTVASSRVIWLWLYKGYQGSNSFGKGRIYRVRVFDTSTGTLLADYVPCYRRADNAAGFYDRISASFYTNNGTGTFTVGPDV